MKALIVCLLAAAATPALAQHQGHMMPMPGMTMPAPAKPAARPAHARPAAKPAAAHAKGRTARRTGTSRHAARPARRGANAAPGHEPGAAATMHDMAMPDAAAAPPAAEPEARPIGHAATGAHAGHAMPGMRMEAAPAAHAGHDGDAGEAGHDMSGMGMDAAAPHAGHDMAGMAAGAAAEPASPPVAPPPPGASSGPAHAADAVFGAGAMAAARDEMRHMHGDINASRVLLDQAEARIRGGRDGWYLRGDAWTGGDIDRLRLRAEAEGDFGRRPEHAEVQALWSHAVDPWFNLQGGLRYDLRPDPERAWLTAGVEGLAPYWLQVEGALFLSTKGELTARAEGEYDLRLTRKLILQPRAELNLSAQRVPELGLGAGLTTAEAGLRLRYQIVPEFAPYVGISWDRAFGATADFRRAAGERNGGWSLLLGLRSWF